MPADFLLFVVIGFAALANAGLKRATARELRCPDLQMAPPENLFLTRTRSGRLRLHAGNSINSVGRCCSSSLLAPRRT